MKLQKRLNKAVNAAKSWLSKTASGLAQEARRQSKNLALVGVALVGTLFILNTISNNSTPSLSGEGPLTITPTTVAESASKDPVSPLYGTNIKAMDVPNERVVILSGEVGDGARNTAYQISKLGNASKKPIYLFINSPGGSVFDGVLIIQAIEAVRAKGTPVHTICTQICASMAAMIFEYGTSRLLNDKAIIMFHPASGGAQGEIDQMVSRLTAIQSYIGNIESQIATRANVSFAQYKAASSKELWLSGAEALTSGYADALVMLQGSQVFESGLNFLGSDSLNSRKTNRSRPLKIDISW